MNKDKGDMQMEDYGSPATDKDETATGTSGTSGRSGRSAGSSSDYDKTEDKGKYSGGTTGTKPGSSEGEEFGEYDKTGKGTDLTVEMANTDVRSGMVKGGEEGADDVGGPGQYGGEAGSVTDKGTDGEVF